jgi:hypothetical protein
VERNNYLYFAMFELQLNVCLCLVNSEKKQLSFWPSVREAHFGLFSLERHILAYSV